MSNDGKNSSEPLENTGEFLKFPPFPTAPPGVTILPFKKFKERGIKSLSNEEGVEVDGLGIPTVELRVKHDTDVCKSNAKRSKETKTSAKVAGQPPGSAVKRKEWWEIWAEVETSRTSFSYNPNLPDTDRILEAASDFKKSRTWPHQDSGVFALWDQFRLFVGLLSNTPIWRKIKSNQPPENDDDDDEDDDFSDGEERGEFDVNLVTSTEHKPPSKPNPRSPYANYDETPLEVENDEAIEELLKDASDQQLEKLIAFLNGPEKSMKIFFSSYMREQGLIWSDRNLIYVPQIVSFFVNFVIRNRAIPEHERSLLRALGVVEIAKKELPLTSTISKALPGDFSKACEALWGRCSGGLDPPLVPVIAKPENVAAKDRVIKRPTTDSVKVEKIKAFEAEAKAAHLEVINAEENVSAIKTAIEDNVGDDVNLAPVGWGSTESWGVANAADTWGVGSTGEAWGEASNTWEPRDDSGWKDTSLSLFDILGPTALPITHETGVVEWSVRRIKAVIPPQVKPPPTTSENSSGPDPRAVEAVLESRFAKMVLEPWLNWDTSTKQDLSWPKILPKSKGPVITYEENVTTPRGKAHNVRTDDVAVLVPPSVADTLVVGMGLGATWVEIARTQKSKMSKGKKLWYMEQLMAILPSYYST